MPVEERLSEHALRRPLVTLASGVSIIVGVSLIGLAATLGSCDAFGGRCPADRPSLLNDDVFGMAAFGTVLLVGVPVLLRKPSWQRLRITGVVAGIAAFVVGIFVTIAAHG